jgi:hypothetical protein
MPPGFGTKRFIINLSPSVGATPWLKREHKKNYEPA